MVDEDDKRGDAVSEEERSERGSSGVLVSPDRILELTAPINENENATETKSAKLREGTIVYQVAQVAVHASSDEETDVTHGDSQDDLIAKKI